MAKTSHVIHLETIIGLENVLADNFQERFVIPCSPMREI
jgi:hypothetical protein